VSAAALLLSYGNPLQQLDAVDFDGANDYLLRGAALTGASNSKLVAFSVWVRIDGGAVTTRKIIAADNAANTSIKWSLELTTASRFRIFGVRSGSDTSTLIIDSASTYAAGGGWLHVAGSFDMADTAKRHLYVNGVSDLGTVSAYADAAIAFADAGEWCVGGDAETPGNDKWHGCMAELWFAPGQYIDLSISANRDKFRSSLGRPVDLGADGSLPTGTAPLVYLHLDEDEAVANFATNRATGGDFSITGTLDLCSDSPSESSANPMSAAGAGAATFVGLPRIDGTVSIAGAAVAQFNTGPFADGQWSAEGTASATFDTDELRSVPMDSDGTASATFEGLATAQNEAVFAPAGDGDATFAGLASVAAALQAQGAGDMAAVSAVAAGAALSADGAGAASGVGASSYAVSAVDLDGANDYLTRGGGLTGAADSKSGIFSAWVRIDGGTGTRRIVGSRVSPSLANRWRSSWLGGSFGGGFLIAANNSADTNILIIQTATHYVASSAWIHLLASWDLDAGVAHFYVNDAEDLLAGSTLTNDTIDYTNDDWEVGANADGTLKFNGCFAEIYLAPGQFLDFSVEANRRKFISADGKPVNLGPDGSTPTGTAPIIYLDLASGEDPDNFGVNKGTGGDFTVVGALEEATSSPSD